MNSDMSALEADLAKRAAGSGWNALDLRRWQQLLLDYATEDEAFRIQLLRFVDVLPTLPSDAALAEHVVEYFGTHASPWFVRRAVKLAQNPILQPLLGRLVSAAVHAMAGRFIAGATPAAALPELRHLAGQGMAYTIDLLGEATLSEQEGDAYLAAYQELIPLLASNAAATTHDPRWNGSPPANVSLKLSALTSQFEPAAPGFVTEHLGLRLKALLRTARTHGAYVHIDMEQFRFKELTHRVFRDVVTAQEFRDVVDVGIVVQAYLKDAPEDLRRLQELARERGAPLTVRLVKGAYWDEEIIVAAQHGWPAPVFQDKAATDAAYEHCTDLLLDAWPHLRPAFGTHNPRSISYAIQKAQQAGLSVPDYEFQMLYGLATELASAVAERGYRLRLYVPAGAILPGMAYLVRRLLENTSNQAWFRHSRGPAPEGPPPATSSPPKVFVNASPAQFHESPVREMMQRSLDQQQSTFGNTYPLLLAGGRVTDRTLAEVRYPADPTVLLGLVAQATPDDVERAVGAASEALQPWGHRPVHQRAEIMRQAAGLLEARRFEFASTMVFESAKPWREADGDVTEAIDFLRYYAWQAEDLQSERSLSAPPGESNIYLREPRGITAVIAPWNFPLAILTGMTAAALVTGNTTIVKPAGPSPIIAFKLVALLHEAGVPPEALQYLPGPGGTVGQTLVEHPLISTIAFTGSNAVGLDIITRATRLQPGQRVIKRVIAELGGKNAIIIDEDADLDLAVADTLTSAFGYAGQKCSACSRLVIVGQAYSETVARLKSAVASLPVGPPHEPQTIVPPVITAEARARIEKYIAIGELTATTVGAGAVPSGGGHYVAPHIFTDVPLDSPLAREEIFGPVLSVFRARDFRDALDIATNSTYGLTGGLFSRHPGHIAHARRDFRVGNLYINRKVTGAVVGRQAFGGLNLSGAGEQAGGPDYLRQFTVGRTVTENTMRRGFAPKREQGVDDG